MSRRLRVPEGGSHLQITVAHPTPSEMVSVAKGTRVVLLIYFSWMCLEVPRRHTVRTGNTDFIAVQNPYLQAFAPKSGVGSVTDRTLKLVEGRGETWSQKGRHFTLGKVKTTIVPISLEVPVLGTPGRTFLDRGFLRVSGGFYVSDSAPPPRKGSRRFY